uniref:Uncharacterized protein n=1 Tax=Sarcophilus harrisii TaxID=9305 RepID=A0A7N4PF13_SARHA
MSKVFCICTHIVPDFPLADRFPNILYYRQLFKWNFSLYLLRWILLLMYKNADDLCGFILYSETLLKLWIISNSFLVDSLGLSKYTTISAEKSDNLVSSLPTLIPLIFFSPLIAKASITNTILNSNGNSGQPCFTPDLIGNGFSLSPLHMMLTNGFK